jgi:hypothetical protein
MDELERFIEFWYGPRRAEYGEPEDRLRKLPLPAPLRRFYAFAGRWPSPQPEHGMPFFYTGSGGHHLHDLDGVKKRRDGKLNFFMEYQGDWDGLTLPNEEDPPVWIEGRWDEEGDDFDETPDRTKQASGSLAKFLITHVLMTSVYESENSPCWSWDERLISWFRRARRSKVLIWSADCDCPNYQGSFFLLSGHVLVHQVGSHYRFVAVHKPGIDSIKERLKTRRAKPGT